MATTGYERIFRIGSSSAFSLCLGLLGSPGSSTAVAVDVEAGQRRISRKRKNADCNAHSELRRAKNRARGGNGNSSRRRSFLRSLECFETELENFHKIDLQPVFLGDVSSETVLIKVVAKTMRMVSSFFLNLLLY